MEFVTIAEVRRAGERGESGELLREHAFNRLTAQYVRLYDPPVDGVTPLDGAGEPSLSVVAASQALAALKKGYTEAPLKKAKKGA